MAGDALLDAWREALGETLAQERRQWERERALIEAQAQREISQMHAAAATLRGEVLELVNARLALVKNGEPGAQGERGPQGEQGIQGPAGPSGEPGPVGDIGPAGEQGAAGPAGPAGEPGPAGGIGPSGPIGLTGERGADGGTGPQGDTGLVGEKGDTGERGPAGLLPIAKLYEPGAVHYAAQVVAHGGGLWQASKDTGQAPPHTDWLCLARPGLDGASPRVRGTYSEGEQYRGLDIVAFNKGSFIAKKDNPGPIPGDDWQLLTAHGGKGEKGVQGPRGERGASGPGIERWLIDLKSYSALPVLTDGSEGAPLDLRDLFEQFQDDAG